MTGSISGYVSMRNGSGVDAVAASLTILNDAL
jgi:hypothetical protein